jgi:type I restriction enzyme S subunit
MTRLKRVAYLRAGGTPASDDAAMWSDEGMPWVTIADMTRDPTVMETERHVSSMGAAKRNLPFGEEGTVLFAMYASLGAVATLGVRASWNQAILGITPKPYCADSTFLRYWLESLQPRLAGLARSTTQDNLNANQVANLPFPLVPTGRQGAIADYLDRETARIDTLIETKQRLARLFFEREAATRTELVIQDDQGVPYRRIRLKFLVPRIGVGLVINPSTYLSDDGVPFLHGSHIGSDGIVFDPPKYMSDRDSRLLEASRLHAGDVIVVRAGYPGRAVVVPADYEGANCASIIILRRGSRLVPEYLANYLNSADGGRQVALVQYGAAQEQINVSHVVHFEIPAPDLSAQTRIVEEIQAACGQLARARYKIAAQVRLLIERRQALITAAVTGQIPIPGAA